ncbi:glucose/galactose transporter [Flexibacter flexilis DSM 6793]|uniref:Glucose/galactose transporter n=1 Tax=Flexibacter flexilis DSM 6793 TaxID=927664 RepID=A0A1I1MA58_9BACT|nr:sugar MFS transporter [Flexibacter flexilis]SFC82244.1 glucose/galactose transporter [Flexibacter flexilis DSM 6793]
MSSNSVSAPNKNYLLPLAMICVLFFIFGFVTWANSTWIQFFQLSFSLSDTQAYLVATASYIAYFFLAIPSSYILKKTGFKNGLVVGLFVLALGSLVFIPAATSQSYSIFLLGIFIQGSALALLQTAANPYLAIIGPIESAAQRISIAGICNKFAGILVPIVMGGIFLKNAKEIETSIGQSEGAAKQALIADLLGRVVTPSVVLAVLFSLLAVVFMLVKLPQVEEDDETPEADNQATNKTSIWQFPHLFLGAFCIFVYVAAEVMAADTIAGYGKQIGLDADASKYLASVTLGCMLVGYLVGIVAIPRFFSQQKALKVCAILGIVFSAVALVTSGFTSVLFIALLGLANSLMWPAIFPLGIQGLGKFTKIGSAIMIMGIVGGAIWPLFFGLLRDSGVNIQLSYFIAVLPCYLYILYFAMAGHKVGLGK